jgi:predicted deacylase
MALRSPRAGPRVTIQALTHGNEVCGAICNDWFLREEVRPTRGTLTLTFANIDAFSLVRRCRSLLSRCVDEDFNRCGPPTCSTARAPRRPRRARELRPCTTTPTSCSTCIR